MKLIIFISIISLFSCGKHTIIKDEKKSDLVVENGVVTNSDPLILATTNGNYIEVKQLIADGLDPNSVDDRDRSLLMIAALNNNYVIVDLLLKSGADSQWANTEGETVFDSTTDNFMFKILADDNSVQDSDWETYLLNLVKEAGLDTQLEVISELQLLFNFGISPNTVDRRASLLMYACNKKLIEIIKFIISWPDTDINLKMGRYSALDYARRSRDKAIIQLLIDNGAKYGKEI